MVIHRINQNPLEHSSEYDIDMPCFISILGCRSTFSFRVLFQIRAYLAGDSSRDVNNNIHILNDLPYARQLRSLAYLLSLD